MRAVDRPTLGCCPSAQAPGGFTVAHLPLGGFAVGRVRTGDLYGLVRTVLTGKLSEHIYALDLGPKLPSIFMLQT